MTTDTEEYTITGEDCLKLGREYWRQVQKSEGFDLEGIIRPPFCTGLIPVDCQRGGFCSRTLLKRYAKVGLHRYNMLKGTSFQFSDMLKYNRSANFVSSYYMTLIAEDSITRKTFQIRIDEQEHGMLALTVSVARLKDEGLATIKKPFVPHFDGDAASASDDDYFQGGLPDWPSDDAFNDTQRFYLVKKPEWQDSDWIRPYLELAVVRCNPDILHKEDQNNILNDLDILKVAIETKEDGDDKLNPKCAHVYITFKGLKETRRSAEVGVRVERKVIIRRVLDEVTGYLTLLGDIWLGNDIEQPSMTLTLQKRERAQSSKTPSGSGEKAWSSEKRSRIG